MSELPEPARWSLATRIAFRFLFSYYLLTALPYLLLLNDSLAEAYASFWDVAVGWADEFVLHLSYDVFDQLGNDAYSWARLFCTVVLAALAAAVWSVLDRDRLQHARLHSWLGLLLRCQLAAAMIRYGTIKAIPSQMIAPPTPSILQQRLGDLFPNHLLWWTVGASPAFERATGLAELLGGVLLLLPRTTLLGALISAANMLLVFLLNVCYDVPVKQGSLLLFVMAVVLVAPDLPRLADVFVFQRRAEPSRPASFFRNRRLDRIPNVLLFVFGLYLIHSNFERAAERYDRLIPPRPPLYGIWSVEEFVRDGKSVPLHTEPDRWQVVLFQAPGSLRVEQMDGSWKTYELGLDMKTKSMTLKPPVSAFSFQQPQKDLLLLDGRLEGHRLQATLRKMPLIRRTT